MNAPVTSAAEGGITRFLNGPLLNAAHWTMSVKNLDPSLHRFYNAGGLALGLFTGRKTMDVLVGETPSGDKINREDLPFFARPLHGLMPYDHYSDESKDRYLKVADNWAPALLGGFGGYAGSYYFGMDQSVYKTTVEAEKNLAAMTLDKAETVAKFRQGEPWARLGGATAMFGSASGGVLVPGITNYGSTLGTAFTRYVPRDRFSTPYFKPLQHFLSGNEQSYPYSPASMLPRLKNYLLHNPDKNPQQTQAMVESILQPLFGTEATPEKVASFTNNLLNARNAHFKDGKGVTDKAAVEKSLSGLLAGEGLEKHLVKVGLDPRDAAIGRNGFVEWFSKATGWKEQLDGIEQGYKQAYAARNKLTYTPDPLLRARTHPKDAKTLLAGGVVAAAGAAYIGYKALDARRHHQADNDALFHRPPEDAAPTSHVADAQVAPAHQKPDKLLGFLEWTSNGLNSAETFGTHRFSCAVGLTVMGMAGMKLMEALTGRDFNGGVVAKDRVPEFLRGAYKKLDYNPFSDHPRDRWMYVMHLAVPSVFAIAGIVGASSHFFRGKTRKAKNAEFIDEFEDKATLAEAGPWTLLTATSASIATPSGNIFLPIPGINYGMSLGTRFTLSSGRKMIFPGIGEAWTGTASKFPLGPTALRDYMIKYAVGNKTKDPEQLEEMAIGILKPWFADVTAEQVQAFVNKVEEDRNCFLKEGGIPEEAKRNCEKQLIAHFKGAGLEETLREIGLDPLKATLGNNGLSATIARWLGAGKELDHIHQEFTGKYTERLHKEQAAAQSAQPQL